MDIEIRRIIAERNAETNYAQLEYARTENDIRE